MRKFLPFLLLASPLALMAQEKEIVPHPRPQIEPPIMWSIDTRANEKPIAVKQTVTVVEENAFFTRVKASLEFTNPNARVMQGELEFPIPEGAFVCGYALEVNGELLPGVVCEKEQARVAFENEVRKGVDPGLAEQVKGNVWKTRIFPLDPQKPRKAEIEYVAPKADVDPAADPIYERDGAEVFVARPADPEAGLSVSDRLAAFAKGTILWDASLSRLGQVASDRARLEKLPETGEWRLVVFANEPEAARTFTSRAELLAAVDAVVYDGGTDLAAALARTVRGTPVALFSDECDTLAETPVDLEADGTVLLASRPDRAPQRIEVRKVTANEPLPKLAPRPSALLATVWAARRMQDLATQAATRKDEFLALGRKYGVAGPGLSLIVLETLEQWLENKIEPPATSALHAEWVKRRAAEDDPIAAKKAQTEHEAALLAYWQARVKWWNDPKPPKKTPTSGLFGGAAAERASQMRRRGAAANGSEPREMLSAPAMAAPMAVMAEEAAAEACAAEPAPEAGAAGSGTAPSVTLKPWDPKTPYLERLKKAAAGEAYAVYLQERATYKDSPAFYLDCAGWFFAAGEPRTGFRILSNLAEFRLENVALWRTMGWRLREAGHPFAVQAFRKALALRPEEGQSRRDLALVLMERGKATGDAAALSEAGRLFHEAAFVNHARRSTRRSNDFQVSVFALEELNGLFAWCEANREKTGEVKLPAIDAAYRRDLPVKLRIVLSWEADETDIDLHVLEPNGEEAFYGNPRTAEGGLVSEDVTTGYGPEEYLKKDLEPGVYKVLTNYYASHQTTLTGATAVQATVYTDWGTAQERMRILTLRLERPKDKVVVGEITL